LVLELYGEDRLHAVANITGGGMENIPRVLPKGTVLPLVDWGWPEPFKIVQDRTGMSRTEMLKTLNCGIGLAMIVAPSEVTRVEQAIAKHGYKATPLGKVTAGSDPSREAEVRY
jgi:phosphoribosylformylglycinamidine cyclo-ligase